MTSPVSPAWTAAWKTKNFAMNPAVGGMPARERKNSVMAPAKTGCRWPRPTHDPISRRSFPFGADSVTTANAPSVIAA